MFKSILSVNAKLYIPQQMSLHSRCYI